MMNQDDAPRTIQRHCGGWLVLSGAGDSLKIGVSAQSRDDAVSQFNEHRARWAETLNSAAGLSRDADPTSSVAFVN